MSTDNKEHANIPLEFWFNRNAELAIPVVSVPRLNINEHTIKNISDSKEVIMNNNLNNTDMIDYIINNNKDINNIQKIEIENNIKNNYINEHTINNFILINNILHMRLNRKKSIRYDMKKYAKFINNYITVSKSKHPNFNLTTKHNIIRIKNYLHNTIGIWFREIEILQFIKEYRIFKIKS